jgi:trehalose-6-phosphate synthase
LLQAIPKLAFGSNTWNRFSDASPRFNHKKLSMAAQMDMIWATEFYIYGRTT